MSKSGKNQKCSNCGFKNTGAPAKGRCVSCGVRLVEPTIKSTPLDSTESDPPSAFSFLWLFIALLVIATLTGGILVGVPKVAPIFDFEGYAGMMMIIPIWAVGGALVGLISPERTFAEPVFAAFFVAIPTAVLLFQQQTVKTMPVFMYVLFSALGLLFTLVGTYAGTRLRPGREVLAE